MSEARKQPVIEGARLVRIESTLRIGALPHSIGAKREGDQVTLRITCGDERLAGAIFDEMLQRLSEGSLRLQIDYSQQDMEAGDGR